MTSEVSGDQSCCGHNTPSLPLAEALRRIDARVVPLREHESVPLRRALGRVSAGVVTSTINVPGHDNAAMDGYAFNADDCKTGGPHVLKVVGSAFAGHGYSETLPAGGCVRIMTGAPVPRGADTVVMQEAVTVEGSTIVLTGPVKPGEHVRLAGEDVAEGGAVLPAGCHIEPAHLGVLASVGLSSVAVIRRPRVALFSTGDELRETGSELAADQIYDSNRENLFGLLTDSGAEVIDLGLVGDNPRELERTLLSAAVQADMIVTSGGASVGEADYMGRLLQRLGTLEFASVAIKPGRPTLFGELAGQAAGTLVFGLPGNPVSVSVTYYQLVRPALLKLSGLSAGPPQITLNARCQKALKTRTGRTEFQRGLLTFTEQEGYVVDSVGSQGSGILSSMVKANCFIIIPDDRGPVAAGAAVDVIPFASLV